MKRPRLYRVKLDNEEWWLEAESFARALTLWKSYVVLADKYTPEEAEPDSLEQIADAKVIRDRDAITIRLAEAINAASIGPCGHVLTCPIEAPIPPGETKLLRCAPECAALRELLEEVKAP